MLRILPESFLTLAMVAQTSEWTLDKIDAAVEGELERRKKKAKDEKNAPQFSELPTAAISRSKGSSGNGIGKKRKEDKGRCWVCGKTGHFAKDCWHHGNKSRNSYPSRGRGMWRSRGARRPWGCGRGYQNSAFQTFQHNRYDNSDTALGLNELQVLDVSAPQPPYQQHKNSSINNREQAFGRRGNEPFGFMSKIIFRSSVATNGHPNSDTALIDSGDTHNFFHSKGYFDEYHKMDIKEVHTASEVSKIVGLAKITLPIDGGVLLVACLPLLKR